jgi:glycosyltransferase involved in cell wall biosynthesis
MLSPAILTEFLSRSVAGFTWFLHHLDRMSGQEMAMGTTNRIADARASSAGDQNAPVVEIVVPVYNEERSLVRQIRRLHQTLRATLPVPWQITIADNGSTDQTAALADELTSEFPDVATVHLAAKGRGRALRATWTRSHAEVVAYTDVDLSTDLTALFPLVASVLSGHAAIAVGSRLAPGAQTTRGPKRELISRTYNLLLHVALGTRFRDAQCGFKAMRADLAPALLAEVHDQAWFFDTELLVRAERHGLRVVEVPVRWVDDPDSRVDILRTARDDLRGVWRLVRELGPRRPVGPLPSRPPARALEHSEAA